MSRDSNQCNNMYEEVAIWQWHTRLHIQPFTRSSSATVFGLWNYEAGYCL